MLVGHSSKGVKAPSFHNGYPIMCCPLYLHCMAWMGRDHAELPSNTIPSHQCFQFHHRFNAIQPMYFYLGSFTRNRWRNRRTIGEGGGCPSTRYPNHYSIHYFSSMIPKNVFLCKSVFSDGLDSAAGSFFILLYGELIVRMPSNKNSRDVKPKSTNISLLIPPSLNDFW